MRVTPNRTSLIKRIGIAILIGCILSFSSNLIFTLILRKNNLTPFYHGGISPNYFEISLITLIPIIVYLVLGISKRKNLPFEILSYCLICSFGILGWTLGIYEQTTWKMIDDPNDTFFLGSLGKFEWHLRQKYFLIGIIIGTVMVFLVNRIRLK